MKKVEISVIIPVYNTEKFLQSCIDSLLNQTMKDMELIFVNDASTDHSLEILQRNAEKALDKIKIINLRENLCQGGARNAGIRVAQGKYIGFVDSDDFVNPDMYSLLYKKAVRTNADVTFIQYMSVPEDEEMLIVSKNEERGSSDKPLIQWHKKLIALDSLQLDDYGRMDLMCYQVGGCVCGLWKKDIITENEVYFPEHLKYEDNYWGSLIKCYIRKVSFIPRVMYYYRQNLNSTTHSRNEMFQFDRVKIEKDLLYEAQKRDLFEKYYQAWEYMFASRYAFGTYFAFFGWFDKLFVEEMVLFIDDLKSIFPKWESNKYYQEIISSKIKRKNRIVSKFPKQYAVVYYNYLVLRRRVKKILDNI